MAEDLRVAERQSTTELPAFQLGKALLESARGPSRAYTSQYYEDQRFALGENQWPLPETYRAWLRDRWKNQSVRNHTMSTIDQKLALILGTEPTIRAEALTEEVSYDERQEIASVVRDELDRLRWTQYREDQTIDGAILGKGILHVYVERDPFTGMYQIKVELVDPNRFYPDPWRTRLHECRYVVHEPDLDMAAIRRHFPDTWRLVNPQTQTIGKLPPEMYSASAEQLIYSQGQGEYSIDRDGNILSRHAEVSFVFVKDSTVTEEVRAVLEKAPELGYHCNACGIDFPRGEADYRPPDDPRRPVCPECASGELSKMMLAPEFSYERERSRKYEFGRLICMTKDALLYDGPSEYWLRECFPFVEYNHNRVTRRFWGQGDVARLKEVQRALNKNIAQAIDNLRMAGNAPLEVPAEVLAYRRLGNRPGDIVPVPAVYMGLARALPTNTYNVQLHQIVDSVLKRDMQEIAGVSDVSLGIAPAQPSSGVEVQARIAASNTRIGRQVQERNQADSDFANIVWQMMNQFYREPRSFNRQLPSGEFETIVRNAATLPREVYIRVSASIDKAEKDKLFGQNLTILVDKGHVGFYPDIMLPLMGAPDREIVKEIAAREEQRRRELAAQAGPAPPNVATPEGATPAPAPPEAAAYGMPEPIQTGGM